MNNYALEIHNLTYSFDDRLLFNNLNFKIKENTITAIVGSNNSGKSTLIKLLSAVYFTENTIRQGNIWLDSNTLVIYKKRVANIDFSNLKFYSDTAYNEILDKLSFTKWSVEKKHKEIITILEKLDIFEYRDKHPSRLSKRNKINLLLAKALVLNPKILVMELSDLNLTKKDKDYIFDIINKITKDITIIYSTNNSEDVLYSNRMLVLHKGNIAIEGSTKCVLKKDSLLLKIGFELPFIVDLSLKLKFYEIIDKIYFQEEDLVKQLWK